MKRKLNIIGIGTVSTILILLMLEVLLAQILTDTILGAINDNLMLLIIMSSLFIFTIIIAFIVGYFITADISRRPVFNASIMSLLCLLLFLFIISNSSLFIFHKQVFSKIHGFQILWIFPQVLVNFGIYILGDVFNLFILTTIGYYVFFIFFLEKFYQSKVKYRE
ncbi:hypothetical protein LCGC14_1092600 [marine sediment metagenome]|uniref:Uncharacterized protein n=1 Tax=marine sediment metagenome TaxID=412755 RepID=A0A0F9MBZ7_9ZZZZ